MATVTYLIAPCSGGTALSIEFSGSSLPTVGGNYYLYFTGATPEGCYEIADTDEPNTGVDGVTMTLGTNYGDCLTCLAVVTPTPTVTKTPTPTPTVTNTLTQTSSQTPTPSVTTTNTPTPSITASSTLTPTPSVTTTNTPTPSITASPTPTVTPSITASPTETPPVTPTPTITPSITASPTATPPVTPTSTTTPTPTKTPPVTPTNTPTPSPTPFYSGISVNEFYEYTADMLGSFSGGTLPPGTVVPYAQYVTNNNDGTTTQVIQLNAISLGGQYGLNN